MCMADGCRQTFIGEVGGGQYCSTDCLDNSLPFDSEVCFDDQVGIIQEGLLGRDIQDLRRHQTALIYESMNDHPNTWEFELLKQPVFVAIKNILEDL